MQQMPIIVLDFNNKRALQVLPADAANQPELQEALERSRRAVTAGVGAVPPPRESHGENG